MTNANAQTQLQGLALLVARNQPRKRLRNLIVSACRCVQAINYWAKGPTASASAAAEADWATSNGTAAWAALMWKAATEIGCAMRLCTDRDPKETVDQYLVVCVINNVQVPHGDEVDQQQRLPAKGATLKWCWCFTVCSTPECCSKKKHVPSIATSSPLSSGLCGEKSK